MNFSSKSKAGDSIFSSMEMKFTAFACRNKLAKASGFVLHQQAEVVIGEITVRHPPTDIPLLDGAILNARKAPLDSNINHPETHETAPMMVRNGRKLYFSRSDSAQWLRMGDIYESHVQGDTMWSPAQALPSPLNNQNRNSVVTSLSSCPPYAAWLPLWSRWQRQRQWHRRVAHAGRYRQQLGGPGTHFPSRILQSGNPFYLAFVPGSSRADFFCGKSGRLRRGRPLCQPPWQARLESASQYGPFYQYLCDRNDPLA